MDNNMALVECINSGKDLYNKLNNVIKKAPLNVNNVFVNGLKEQLNNNVKKDSLLYIKVMDSDCSTVCETLDLDTTNNYTTPGLDSNVLNALQMDSNNIIFNKEYKIDTYKNNPLFYVNYKDIVINVYGYNPGSYKYVNNYYGLYLCSNKPFYYYGINPFTIEQHYIIINL